MLAHYLQIIFVISLQIGFKPGCCFKESINFNIFLIRNMWHDFGAVDMQGITSNQLLPKARVGTIDEKYR